MTSDDLMQSILGALGGHHAVTKAALRKSVLKGPLAGTSDPHEVARLQRAYDMALWRLDQQGRVKIDRTAVEVK